MNQLAIKQENRLTLTPTNMAEALQFADMLAKSDIVPKDYQGKPGNVIVAIQWGMELGLQPLQAMQNIAVINGRPSLWGDGMLALVMSCPDCEDISESFDPETITATCTVKRRGKAPVVRTFSLEDAKRAGLAGKQGPWQQYRDRMIQMRARGFALRDSFADVLRGMYMAEEARDLPQPERDITDQGETVATTAPKTNAEKAREAMDKRKAEKAAPKPAPDPEQGKDDPIEGEFMGADGFVTIEEVMAEISRANSPAEINAAADMAAKLADEGEREMARESFAKRVKELKAHSKVG